MKIVSSFTSSLTPFSSVFLYNIPLKFSFLFFIPSSILTVYMASSRVQKAGPFGNSPFSDLCDPYDEKYTGIRQIILTYSDIIHSITVEYDNNGVSVWSKERPSKSDERPSKGDNTVLMNFSMESEYLMSVSVYHNNKSHLITMMRFQTNKRVFGPFGEKPKHGTHFSFPPSNGKIVGFFGKYGRHSIPAIGGYWVPIPPSLSASPWPYKDAPFGGTSEKDREWDDGVHTTLRRIHVWYARTITGIWFEYDNNGNHVTSEMHGNQEGRDLSVPTKLYSVEISYPDEYLISVSGSISNTSAPNVIQSLTFVTNKNTYGPIGASETRQKFIFPPDKGKIIGFYGTADSELVSIGVYRETGTVGPEDGKQSEKVDPKNNRESKNVQPEGSKGSGNVGHEGGTESGLVEPTKGRKSVMIGPEGGLGGKEWNDGIYARISKIKIWTGDVVDSLKIQYVTSTGQLVSYERRGSSSGGKKDGFEITDPDEYLTSVIGYYDTLNGFSTPFIRSLTFKTNKRTFAYGQQYGTEFKLGEGDVRIVGFLGRSGHFLDSIGAHVIPNSGV